MRRLTAHASTRDLLAGLARANWSSLDGRQFQRCRSTLTALVYCLDYRSGSGMATVGQIADRAGLSARWVRHCLYLLEDLGLIQWARGGIKEGRPAPSLFRIVKRALVALIELARPHKDKRDAQRQAETSKRIASIQRSWLMVRRKSKPGAQTPLPLHEELDAPLPPLQGRTPREGRSPRPSLISSAPEGARSQGEEMEYSQPRAVRRGELLALTCPQHGRKVTECEECRQARQAPTGTWWNFSTCDVCGRAQSVCQELNSKLAEEYRHDFRPILYWHAQPQTLVTR